jgi:hypothetical protein
MATTTLTNQFKLDLLKGGHNFKASGGIAYKILLIKTSPSGTYDKTLTNVGTPGTGSPTTSNVGTDEVANGSGYTTGGFALTNVDPALYTDTAVATFSANPSWSSATFSTVADVIYTADATLGTANRTVEINDFGGTQTVSAGTLTLTLPTAGAATGLIRIA